MLKTNLFCIHVKWSGVGRSKEWLGGGKGGPADLLPGKQAAMLFEMQLVNRFSQSQHMNTQIFAVCEFLDDPVLWSAQTACGDSPLHVFNSASISLIWWSCRWFYYHGCVFAGDTASPANTQQMKNSACLLSLQPLDCSVIHLDNSREETAGTTLNARLCCCTMFTSLHTW